MLKLTKALLAVWLLASISNCKAPKTAAEVPKAELKTLKEKSSYAIGMDIGTNFKSQSLDVDPALVSQGMKDALEGKTARMTQEQIQETMMELQKEMMNKKMAVSTESGTKNETEGKAFLEENAKKPDVKVTKSGLQYKVLTEGKGPSPKLDQSVTCHYKGTLIDGTEFDSSIKRGEPATFPLNGVIKGWTEALQLMKKGSKWELYVPADLAYGPNGAGEKIGPNATLIFEVELLEIK